MSNAPDWVMAPPPAMAVSVPPTVSAGRTMAALSKMTVKSLYVAGSVILLNSAPELALRRPTLFTVPAPVLAKVTVDLKSLAWVDRLMFWLAVSSMVKLAAPVTVRTPLWVMWPLDVTPKVPVTVLVPSTVPVVSLSYTDTLTPATPPFPACCQHRPR
ncbi:MAG: hypothetical protein IPK34_00005 [Ramlibacter sp.]|nr:hypothetical protein [Ramlibacter sp.]